VGARTRSALAAVAGFATVLGIAAAPYATGSGESETVVVDAANPAGAKTVAPLTAGVTYTITVSGTFTWGLAGGNADAECSALAPDPSWQANRFGPLYGADDNLDLYVNGAAVDWQPASGAASDGPCDSNHSYRLAYTPKATGPGSFAVTDKMNSNKAGKLTVTVMAPAATAQAAPAQAAPASPKPSARRTSTPRVLGAGSVRPVAPAPAVNVPALPNGRNRFGSPNPVVPTRTERQNFAAIKPPTLPKQPFHLTTLGWFTLVASLVLVAGATTFVVATRATAVDSPLRLGLASVLRMLVGRGTAT